SLGAGLVLACCNLNEIVVLVCCKVGFAVRSTKLQLWLVFCCVDFGVVLHNCKLLLLKEHVGIATSYVQQFSQDLVLSGPRWWLSNGSEPVLLDYHCPYDRKRCNRYRDDKRLLWDFQCESKESVGEGGDDMGLGNYTTPLSAGGAQGDPNDKFIVSYWEFCRERSPMRIDRSALDLFQEPRR
ncbi:hypothetical protein U1Q18_039195, partial [Sarracenia purpurea var. burkii]